jgi:opacity protein-like surface antigen
MGGHIYFIRLYRMSDQREGDMMNNTEGCRRERNFLFQYIHKAMPAVLFLLFVFLALFAAGPGVVNPAFAQPSGQVDGERDEDFLFSEPGTFLGFRVGRFFPEADSDLFDWITSELTLDEEDFRAWTLAVDVGLPLNERIELLFSAEYSDRSVNSEFRDWVDEEGLPITQKTTITQFPLTAGVKYVFLPRGRQVGRYAWLPSRFVPYVGAGAGVLYYRFGQSGDFVDYSTLEIFSADLRSSGWSVTGYLGGGVDINLTKRTYVTADLRYSLAEADLDDAFIGFEPLDLAGWRASVGLQWRF